MQHVIVCAFFDAQVLFIISVDDSIAERDTFALLTYFDMSFFNTLKLLFYHAKVPSCKLTKKKKKCTFYMPSWSFCKDSIHIFASQYLYSAHRSKLSLYINRVTFT